MSNQNPGIQGLSIIGPPTSLTSLVATIVMKGVDPLLNLVFGNIWQNYEAKFIANTPPAATFFNDELYVFYASPAMDVPSLFYNTCTGTTWSTESSVKLAQTQTGPAAATFNNQVYVFWQNINVGMFDYPSNGVLSYTTLGASYYWDIGSGAVMTGNPSALVFNDEIYVFYQTSTGNQLGYAHSSDGANWSVETWPNTGIATSPSAITFTDSSGTDHIYVFYQNTGTGYLSYTSTDAAGNCGPGLWLQPQGLSIPITSTPPVAAACNGSIYVFYEDPNWGVRCTISADGSTWSIPVSIGRTSIADSNFPAVATVGSQIYCMMQGPTYLLWYTALTPGSSALGAQGYGMCTVPQLGINSPEGGLAGSPAVIYNNETVFGFYPGGDSIFCLPGNASTGWGSRVTVVSSGVVSGSSPGPVAFNNLLYCFYQGSGNAFCYTTSSDNGTSWASPTTVTNRALWCSPSAVVNGDTLYVFHSAANDNEKLYCSTLDTTGNWSSDTEVMGMAPYYDYNTYSSPTGFVFNGTVYIAYIPKQAGTVCIVPYPNPNYDSGVINLQQSPWGAVGVTVLDGMCYVFFQNGNDLYYVASSSPIDTSMWNDIVATEVTLITPSIESQAPEAVSSFANYAVSCVMAFFQ